MKQKIIRFSQQYGKALRTHLQHQHRADLQPAVELGRLAVALGLETLELARIHEQVFGLFKAANLHDQPKNAARGAEMFFSQTLTPMVETHRAAKQSKIDLNRLNAALNRRTLELAATNRQLQRGVVRRKSVEAALKKSSAHYTSLLKDSLRLQEGYRQITHQVLAAQEAERLKISRELQGEIAQTLLGISVRLISLKQEAHAGTAALRNEIASAQQLVVISAKSVRRVARKFRNP